MINEKIEIQEYELTAKTHTVTEHITYNNVTTESMVVEQNYVT